MIIKRRQRAHEFNTQIALSTSKGTKTLVQISSDFGVSSVQMGYRKRSLSQGFTEVFRHKWQSLDIVAPITYNGNGELR